MFYIDKIKLFNIIYIIYNIYIYLYIMFIDPADVKNWANEIK
jgi:hypothetical protein